ncbi:MAG: Clp1/GlmU family protein [Crenarchaeota archaeon]|nr:Clp1/GlmU family protein [Thermoproteota archaeon]
MRQRIVLRVGKTLLVDGPATVQVASGMVNVMGAVFAEGSWVKVRGFRRTPFHAEQSEASLVVEGNNYRVIDGSTIPSSWLEAAEKTATEEKGVVMVVGEADSGKTSLATFLVNYYLNFQGEVGIVDSDPGQNDLGIPGTVSGGVVNKGLSDLSQVKPEVIEFVGFTAPESGVEELKDAVVRVLRRLRERGIGKIVLNTDGWADSKGLSFKAELIRVVKPSFVISLLDGEKALVFTRVIDPSTRMIQVEKSRYVKRRSRIHRRTLRMLNYRRHFARARLVKRSLNETVFLNHPFLKGEPARAPWGLKELGFEELEAKLYMGTLYVRIRDEVEEPVVLNVGGKKTIVLGEGWERGLLVGLGRESRIIGVGIIESLSGSEVTVKTPLTTGFDTIKLGEIKLDASFNERNFYWRPSRHHD